MITDVQKDVTNLTMVVTSEFDATVDQVWQLWSDPRKLERWWGPPTYPATVVEHSLTPGGAVTYFMTGPEGDQHHGYWQVLEVDAPHGLAFQDGFADDGGAANDAMPTTIAKIAIADLGGGKTQMSIESTFSSLEEMQQLVEHGMEEGIQQALSQIDAILAHAKVS